MSELSRVEQILTANANGESYTGKPLSRVEALLLNLGLSGGSGSANYGSENAGKFLQIGNDGVPVPVSLLTANGVGF